MINKIYNIISSFSIVRIIFRLFDLYIYNRLTEIDLHIIKKLKINTSVDVGAHVGHYAYYLSNISKLIICFEPIPYLFKDLKKIFFFKKNIIFFNCALSKKNFISYLNVPILNNKISYGLSTLKNNYEKKKIIKVKVRNGDKLLYQFNKIDLIKIDVEGYEQKVLAGLTFTIKKNYPIFILEIDHNFDNNFLKTFKFMYNFNYESYFSDSKCKLKKVKITNKQDLFSLQKKSDFNFEKNIRDFRNFRIRKKYISNFWFVHKKSKLKNQISRYLAK